MPLRLGKSIDRVPSIDELTFPRLQKTGIIIGEIEGGFNPTRSRLQYILEGLSSRFS